MHGVSSKVIFPGSLTKANHIPQFWKGINIFGQINQIGWFSPLQIFYSCRGTVDSSNRVSWKWAQRKLTRVTERVDNHPSCDIAITPAFILPVCRENSTKLQRPWLYKTTFSSYSISRTKQLDRDLDPANQIQTSVLSTRVWETICERKRGVWFRIWQHSAGLSARLCK